MAKSGKLTYPQANLIPEIEELKQRKFGRYLAKHKLEIGSKLLVKGKKRVVNAINYWDEILTVDDGTTWGQKIDFATLKKIWSE